ncbi:MAG TPA: type II secretion system protein GspM [Candidatus Binatia bacterium]
MNWRARWERLSGRERTLIGAAGAVLGLLVIRMLVISPFLAYREGLQDEIASHREMLQNDQAYLARASDITKHLESVRTQYAGIRTQLVPGDTPTLAAASLQDTLHNLATEKGITVQSTQVMREETVGEFQRIAVRVTVTGELHELADFLMAIEYGKSRFAIPFLEISRRGAVLRGQSARALAATIEVNAFLQGTGGKVEPAAAPAPEEAAQGQPQPGASGAPAGPAAAAPGPAGNGTPQAAPGTPAGNGPPMAVPPQAHGRERLAVALEGLA